MRLKKFNEGFISDNKQLKTDINIIDVNFTSDIDIDSYNSMDIKMCYVYWTYDMEVRDYGIKSITPTINKVVLVVDYDMYGETEDETYTETKTYEYDIDDNIEIEYINDKPTIPYYPTEIEIDEKSKNIIITF